MPEKPFAEERAAKCNENDNEEAGARRFNRNRLMGKVNRNSCQINEDRDGRPGSDERLLCEIVVQQIGAPDGSLIPDDTAHESRKKSSCLIKRPGNPERVHREKFQSPGDDEETSQSDGNDGGMKVVLSE